MVTTTLDHLCGRCSATLSIDGRPQIDIDKIRSMHIPSGAELAHILSVVEHCQLDLDRYDEEISKVSQVLDELKCQRGKLQNYTNSYAYMRSSVRKLPAEVLGEIFAECCRERSLVIGESETDVPALQLSQTCSFWRKVMLSRPELWSNLGINLENTDKSCILDLVQLYLARSNNVGLRLYLDSGNIYLIENLIPYGWEVLKSLLSEKGRWVDVSFYLHEELYRDAYKYVSFEDYETQGKIERLSLTWPYAGEFMFGPTALFRIFDNEPSLHSLHLQSFHQQLRLPFQKIEKLEIVDHFTHYSDLLLLLLQCSHLKMLDISFSGTVNDGLDELSLLTMEHLSSLKLFSLNEFTGFIEVVSSIVCPMLTALLLNFDDSDYDRDSGSPHNMSVERFNSFLQRSACQISTLELSGTSRLFFVDNNLTQFLQALPTVRDFTLSLDTFYPEGSGENYLQRLTFVEPPISEMSRTSTLLPQLQSFRLRLEEKTPCFSDWDFWNSPPSLGLPDAEAIFSMVHSRRLMHASPGVERLIHFELSFEATRYSFGVPWVNNFHSTVEPRLRVLENEGLSLSLNLKVPNGPEPCSFDCLWGVSEDL